MSFKLLHVAKYAKGHYAPTDDIIADLILCLELDDYMPSTKSDIVYLLSNNICPLFRDTKHFFNEYRDGVHPELCWKRGYLHSDDYRDDKAKFMDGEKHNKRYDMDIATIKFFLSYIKLLTMTELGIERLPDSCIPSLKKEKTLYCEVMVSESTSPENCIIAYDDYGKLILLNEENRSAFGIEPQHIYFCDLSKSKEGQIAYDVNTGSVGMNTESFNKENKTVIASTDPSLSKYGVVLIPKLFASKFINLKGDIKNIELLLDSKSNLVTNKILDGYKEICLSADCKKYINRKIEYYAKQEATA